jgi:16S rRNA (uracil1498-N3)-methyltransferase
VTAPRFLVEPPLAPGATLRLPQPVAHHAARVLRLRDGADIVLFDGRGGEYRAMLQVDGAGARALIGAFDPVERESPLSLTLLQALVAAEKLDWIVEKAVELGVARLLVVPMQRSVVRLDGERGSRRLRHWREIARAACCQCGRNRLPAVDLCAGLDAAMSLLPDGAARLLLDPAATPALPEPITSAAILVGPEGGLTDAESSAAQAAGFVAMRLGPRTLRTETAGLAALAALQALGGDFAGS